MNESIKTIIVDDEPKACRLLQLLIEEVDTSIDIVAIYNDPVVALKDIDKLGIQLIFLDIDMPEMSGFDFLKKLGDTDYQVVFVTGYDQYAINALKMAAAGYLLKPVVEDELHNTLSIVKKRLQLQSQQEQNKILLENLSIQNALHKKIGIPTTSGISFVRIEDIEYLEGTEKYTTVHLIGQKNILSSYNIGEFIKMVDNAGFFQVHRSYVINPSHVKTYSNEGVLTTDSGNTVPVARRRREDFLRLMSTIHR